LHSVHIFFSNNSYEINIRPIVSNIYVKCYFLQDLDNPHTLSLG